MYGNFSYNVIRLVEGAVHIYCNNSWSSVFHYFCGTFGGLSQQLGVQSYSVNLCIEMFIILYPQLS